MVSLWASLKGKKMKLATNTEKLVDWLYNNWPDIRHEWLSGKISRLEILVRFGVFLTKHQWEKMTIKNRDEHNEVSNKD